jgi:CheY-like chemotaxis protein
VNQDARRHAEEFDPRFKIFYDLMRVKVRDILLVSSLYDACIMEEDCRLAERIVNEYRGLNLSQPPRLTWVSTAEEALETLVEKQFDLVITMPRVADMDAFRLGREIKRRVPNLPVILLTHAAMVPECGPGTAADTGIDRIFVWSGNADLLLAQIKSVEDRLNVEHDTNAAGVRVILFVEDSPVYVSSILPILYREVVGQTQDLMEEKLNEEHRLLTMRARAKILVAQNYEEAVDLYERYKPFILGVISDTRFPLGRETVQDAGIRLLERIRDESPDVPLLLTSSEPANRELATTVGASFVDKNSPSLHMEIRDFFLGHLGFGDFVFRMPDGREVARVSNVRAMEKALTGIPAKSFVFHALRNDFSRWLFARAETVLASRMRPVTLEDFQGDAVENARRFVIESLRARRKWRQKGVVADFDPAEFDPETDFLKIGQGSLGGKARGLAFVATMLKRKQAALEKYSGVDVIIPRTLVITTEAFDALIRDNHLAHLSKTDDPDETIAQAFLAARFPEKFTSSLQAYLAQVRYPLAVRSSGLLEDAQFRAYAGLYRTYMIPNNHPDPEIRLAHLMTAVRLVYASTYFQGPKSFARRVGQRTEEEKMAVIIQELIGEPQGDYFYPAISGVAQSHNYYPFSRQKPEDGIATIALGLGRTVVEGGKALRFSPKHPGILPQFSSVEAILENGQRKFYALGLGGLPRELGVREETALEIREIDDAVDEPPVRALAGVYQADEHRIKDNWGAGGQPVMTFASVLKYKTFPLADLLVDVLEMSHEGLGAPVEIEFSAHFSGQARPRFAFLQVRPMSARAELVEVVIDPEETRRSFCVAGKALGNGDRMDIRDIVFVKPDVFDPAQTSRIARDIGRINGAMVQEDRPFLLVGPGRWGSADRWLGIPVTWSDISMVGAMVEAALPVLTAEPSQGSHFFHNVTTLGIPYLTVGPRPPDFFDWAFLARLPVVRETDFVAHVALETPFRLKVDGRTQKGVMYMP